MSSKCTERRSILTGVPVFILADRMPWLVMLSVNPTTAGSAMRPPGSLWRPMCISPLRNVPAVITTLPALRSTPQTVFMPTALPFSTISSEAWSCQMSRFGVASSTVLHCQMYFSLSHWARGLHTAGPLERFSIRNCIAVASVTRPISPPRASISLTICPFAIPPTAGLQLICAILFMSMVTRHVFAPMFAAATAASHPACPPPITKTSYLKFIYFCLLDLPVSERPVYSLFAMPTFIIAWCREIGSTQTGANLSIKIEFLHDCFDLSLIWSIFAVELTVCNTYYKVLWV